MGCCETLSGITRECDSNIGGIRRAWIACHDSIGKPVTELTDEGKKIVTLNTANAEIKLEDAFNLYEFRKQTGSVTTTITRDDAAGSLFYDTSIVLQFSKMETSKRIEINTIAMNDMVVIIEDNNKRFWYFGYYYPVTLSDGTAETGTAFGDMNGYNITLNYLSKRLPFEVSETAMAKLL